MKQDHGPNPYVVNILEATLGNENYRTTIWTGQHLQVTLMTIKPGEDIGLEVHPDNDQFLRIEDGSGIVQMGDTDSDLTFKKDVKNDDAILIPAGKYHNVLNTSDKPLRLYSIYSPAHHPFGTIHKTKAIAEEEGD